MRNPNEKWQLERRATTMRRAIEEYERGTATQAAFCRRQGIPLSTFTYWRRRLRGEGGGGGGGGGRGAHHLLEVEVVEEADLRGRIELRLPGGVTAVVGADASEELLRRIFRAVAKPC